MHITALGHSALLLELQPDEREQPTRLLVDPWLSDYCVGDVMGRWPRLRWTGASLGPIDGVFLSHAHTDHLDPYTLVRLWRELAEPPVLLLPATLRFLLPTLRAHLPDLQVQVLLPDRTVDFRGAKLRGLHSTPDVPSNEDDVMVLLVQCGGQIALIEADVRLDVHDAQRMGALHRRFTRRGVDSVAWLTTENELDATMAMALCDPAEQRMEQAWLARTDTEQAADALYRDVARPSPWSVPHLVRAVHGQGLAPPPEVDAAWARLLYPVRVEDRVRIERRVAAEHGLQHSITALRPGWVHRLADGRLTPLAPTEAVTLVDDHDPRSFDAQDPFVPELPCAPVQPGLRNADDQEQRLLDLMNQRLLPFLVGLNRPALHQLLAQLGGSYRIRVHYGDPSCEQVRDYALALGDVAFAAVPVEGDASEAAWANDLEDFLDGRADEFTAFFRRKHDAPLALLPHVMGLPVLGYDLAARKVALHFERAAAGEDPGSWVRPRVPVRPEPDA